MITSPQNEWGWGGEFYASGEKTAESGLYQDYMRDYCSGFLRLQ